MKIAQGIKVITCPASGNCNSKGRPSQVTVVRKIRAGHRVGRRSTRRQERVICYARGYIINTRQELVQLAGKFDWDFIDGEIAPRGAVR